MNAFEPFVAAHVEDAAHTPEQHYFTVVTCGGSVALCITMCQARELSVTDVLHRVAENLQHSHNKMSLLHSGSKLQLSNMMRDVLATDLSTAMHVVIAEENEVDWKSLEQDRTREFRLRARIEYRNAFSRCAVLQSSMYLMHFAMGAMSLYCSFCVRSLTCHAPWPWWYGSMAAAIMLQSFVNCRGMWAMFDMARRFDTVALGGGSALSGDAFADHFLRKEIHSEVNWILNPFGMCGACCLDVAFTIWGSVMSGITWNHCHDEARYSVFLMVASCACAMLVICLQVRVQRSLRYYIEHFLRD